MHSTIRIFYSLALAWLFVGELTSCDQGGPAETTAATPVSPLDATINEYEKATNEYSRFSKKHTAGDVSVTVLLIQARYLSEQAAAKLQKEADKLSPEQKQRVAAIAQKAASVPN